MDAGISARVWLSGEPYTGDATRPRHESGEEVACALRLAEKWRDRGVIVELDAVADARPPTTMGMSSVFVVKGGPFRWPLASAPGVGGASALWAAARATTAVVVARARSEVNAAPASARSASYCAAALRRATAAERDPAAATERFIYAANGHNGATATTKGGVPLRWSATSVGHICAGWVPGRRFAVTDGQSFYYVLALSALLAAWCSFSVGGRLFQFRRLPMGVCLVRPYICGAAWWAHRVSRSATAHFGGR
jgi:hypothetical protein